MKQLKTIDSHFKLDMKNQFIIYLLNFCIKYHILCQEDEEIKKESFCRERNRPIGTENGDLFQIVETTIGQSIVLQCHYCREDDDEQPKIWYKSNSIGNFTKDEVKIDMNNNRNLSRIYVGTDHSLILRNVTSADSSFYFCQPYKAQGIEKDLNFYIDILVTYDNRTLYIIVVDVNKTSVESGNITDWAKYQKENFFPINQLFLRGNGPEFVRLRENFKVHMEIITTWDAWSECEVCGRPLGEGIMKKRGHCRIKITTLNSTDISESFSTEELQLLRSTEIGCRSKIVNNVLPGIFNLTKIIPDFVQIDSCTGTCNPDAEGKYRGWKSTKKSGFKYRKTIVLTENAHLTLVCPESTLENIVTWKRNGKTLPAGESVEPPKSYMEPKITVDTFNTLYLHEVTKDEEGNYTCHVDNIRMQQTIIFVISKSRLLTQALLRHMMYLGFILSLTISCYIAGLVITWTRRHKFKTYEEIKKIRKKKLLSSDSDDDDDDEDDNESGDDKILIKEKKSIEDKV